MFCTCSSFFCKITNEWTRYSKMVNCHSTVTFWHKGFFVCASCRNPDVIMFSDNNTSLTDFCVKNFVSHQIVSKCCVTKLFASWYRCFVEYKIWLVVLSGVVHLQIQRPTSLYSVPQSISYRSDPQLVVKWDVLNLFFAMSLVSPKDCKVIWCVSLKFRARYLVNKGQVWSFICV